MIYTKEISFNVLTTMMFSKVFQIIDHLKENFDIGSHLHIFGLDLLGKLKVVFHLLIEWALKILFKLSHRRVDSMQKWKGLTWFSKHILNLDFEWGLTWLVQVAVNGAGTPMITTFAEVSLTSVRCKCVLGHKL